MKLHFPVVGIDPSLTGTGVAYRLETGSIWCGSVITVRGAGNLADYSRRIVRIVNRVSRMTPQPCLTVIESPALTAAGMAGALSERIGLYWRLVEVMALRGAVVAVAPPTRAMYAANNGHGTKRDVLASIRARFPHLYVSDHNEADALALMSMGCRWLDCPVDGEPTDKMLAAMTTPHWPGTDDEGDAA